MAQPSEREIEVFNVALELPASERIAYLDQACAGDDALRQRIDELLKASAESCPCLEGAPAVPLGAAGDVRQGCFASEKPGDRIGRYKLLQQIGEGGCGVVYMAEQEEPVRRRVALKVIKLGMDTKNVIARFEAERQALALMDHPNIAKVLDAGATDAGRPYFVMELVRGIKITDYCDQYTLSTRERLDLFIQVCQAIQHAHQKGIIHRDIKPSNILVTKDDRAPVPKVIDFGIAKATQGKLTDQTLFTAFEQFIGTPAYMSPEQAEMRALDIDTRSDIYSLGVLLFELLTGQTPFDTRKLLQAGLDEIRRTIREQEPARPSTCLSTLPGDNLTAIATHRNVEPPKLIHLVQGDLDWIVMKALEKDRTRRYETANGLAADIQRHLSNEPVVACPPSNLYRFQKLVRRNKLAFFAAGAVTTALTIGLVVSMWMFVKEKAAEHGQALLRQQAEAEKKKAEMAAAKSQQVAEFLEDMLQGVAPSVALGRDTAMLQEILDKTAERVGQELTNQPEVEMELCLILARSYDDLGLYQQEEEMARQSLQLARLVVSEESLPTAQALYRLGKARWRLGKYDQVEEVTREALATFRKLLGNENPAVADSLSLLAFELVSQNKLPEAESIDREVLAMRQKLLGNEHNDVADALNNLGNVFRGEGKLVEAETILREALAMRRKLVGNEHPEVARLLNNLALVLRDQGKLAEAETMFREALAMRIKMLGTEHPDVGASIKNLTELLVSEGKLDDLKSLDVANGTNAAAVVIQDNLGWRYQNGLGVDRNFSEAVKWYRKAAEQGDSSAQMHLGWMYEMGMGVAKDYAEAVKWDRRAADQGDSWGRMHLGWLYEHGAGVEKDYAKAVELFRESAKQGNPWGQTDLGQMYKNGWGVEKNYAEALKMYLVAGESADADLLNELAWRLATSDTVEMRNGTNAVRFAEKAVKASPQNPGFLNTLAAAYAETQQFNRAATTEQEAIGILPSDQDKNGYESRLKLYQAHKSYRAQENP